MTPLTIIADARGAVLHMLRSALPVTYRFSEIYFSEVNPGVIKAWKRHHRMTQRLTVPVGRVKFAIYDNRPGSSTIGRVATGVIGRPDAYLLLIIPPMLWYGFRGVAEVPSLVANCTDVFHDPDEVEQSDDYPGEGQYVW